MGRGLGDQIAVLDGLSLGAADVVSGEGEQMLALAAGGTRSGGSSWEPGIPTLYGRADLAGLSADFDLTSKADLLNVIVNPAKQFMDYFNQSGENVMAPRVNVVDPSRGTNYTGGSSYSAGIPLVMSNAGLAGAPTARHAHRRRHKKAHSKKAGLSMANQMQPLNLKVQQVLPGVQLRANVIDPSGGANYGGGSSYYGGSPLLPSNSGLARMAALDGMAAMDMRVKQVMPDVQERKFVIDPSGGANYGGGSTFYPGSPLLPSNSGLADCGPCRGAMADLRAAAGYASRVTQPMRDVQFRNNVIDPSGGANYGGGSTFYPGAPLLPSNSGLAALSAAATANAKSDDDVVKNASVRQKFANAAAFNEYVKFGGENEVMRMKTGYAKALKSKDYEKAGKFERALAVLRIFRAKIMAVPMQSKITPRTVLEFSTQAVADSLRNPAAMAGLSAGLGDLEGRIARRIKKRLKKAVSVIGKVAKVAVNVAAPAFGIPPPSMLKGAVKAFKK